MGFYPAIELYQRDVSNLKFINYLNFAINRRHKSIRLVTIFQIYTEIKNIYQ